MLLLQGLFLITRKLLQLVFPEYRTPYKLVKQPINKLFGGIPAKQNKKGINKITYIAFNVETDQISKSNELKAGYTTQNKYENESSHVLPYPTT